MKSRRLSALALARCTLAGLTLAVVSASQLRAAEDSGTYAPAASHSSSTSPSPSSSRSSEATRVDFNTFRLVTERNIFNASRSGSYSRSPRETRRPTRVDSLGLVGTMDYEKGTLAFFDGSSSDYRKALKQDASIAGWKLASVSMKGVELTDGTNHFQLKVGMGLRREEEGEWKLNESGDFASGSGGSSGGSGFSASSSGSSSSSSHAAAPPSGDQAEMLRKLMERRAKEDQ